jgi:hypothetical protein
VATVQSVIDATMVRFMDPDKTTWTDAQLLTICQKAVDYLQQVLTNRNDEMATKAAHLHTEDGTEAYTWASLSITDFVAMYRGPKHDQTGVWIDDAFLTPCRYTERVAYADTDESEPEKYYITDTGIGFLPIPDTAYQVDFMYFYKQPTLALGTTMPFNGIFDLAIGAFIDSMAAAMNEMDISNITQLYKELEAQALGISSMRTPIKPAMRNRRR